jgi:DNA-binding transcriptional LysR family regulator
MTCSRRCSNIAPMNLHRCRIFCLVVDCQSFAAAAERLLLRPASVHLQVRALERSLGARLLTRDGRRMVPTEAGQEVYRVAQRMLVDADQLTLTLADLRAARVGRLAVGASASASYLLAPVLTRFGAGRPGARVVFQVDQGELIGEAVLNGQLDFGVVAPPGIPEGLTVEPLCETQSVLLAAPDHPLAQRGWAALTDLERETLVAGPEGTWHRQYVELTLAAAGHHRLPIAWEVSNLDAIRLVIRLGAGIGFLPSHTVQSELAAGVLQVIELRDVPPINIQFVLVARQRAAPSALAREAIAYVRQSLAVDPASPTARRLSRVR